MAPRALSRVLPALGLLAALALPGRLGATALLAEKVTGPASCAECVPSQA